MEALVTRALPLAVVTALGAGAMAGCGGDGESAPPPEPVATRTDAGPTGCVLVAERSSNQINIHAEVEGAVPNGTKLALEAVYSGRPKYTDKQTVSAATTVGFPKTHNGNELWIVKGKLDEPGKGNNQLCESAVVNP